MQLLSLKQRAWMKPYTNKNSILRCESKSKFEKDFFKLLNNAVFRKTMENLRKHRDIKLVTTNRKRKILTSNPNYHCCKCFSEHLMAIEMKKIKMNKPIYVGQAVLDISKTLMYEFWYDYLKPKYDDKVRLCYMDILPDLDEWSDTSKIDKKLNRCIPIGENAGVTGKFKDELNVRVMSEFFALASKLYAFLDIDDNEEMKAKGVRKCVAKKVLKFNHYMKALLNKTRTTQQRFESDHHTITREEINKIALSRKDGKRIQSFDRIHTYPVGIDNDLFNELESEIFLIFMLKF